MKNKTAVLAKGGLAACLIIGGTFFVATNARAGGERDGIVNNIRVKPNIPEPQLTEVTTENIGPYNKPLIKGTVTKDITRVIVVIDNVLKDEVVITNQEINYQSIWPLKLGEHFVYAVGVDKLGWQSRISNIMNFFVVRPADIHEPKISAITIDNNVSGADRDEAATATHLKINPIVMATSTVMLRDLITPDLIFFMVIIGILIAWIIVQARK